MSHRPGLRQQILAIVRKDLPGVDQTSTVFRTFVVARAAKRVGSRGFKAVVQVTGYDASFVETTISFLRYLLKKQGSQL